MKILICLSNVPDTTTKIKFTDNNTKFDANGVQWIINPWDELALTRAVDLKEKNPATVETVSVITVGLQDTEPTIRKALAIGADNAFRINAEPKDSFFVASQLAEVIKKENYDIILAGIESSDYNGNAVGSMLAELLDMTSVSAVSKLDIDNGGIIINREIDGGTETLAVKTPFVAVVQKGIAIEPKIPAMRGIMMARTKPLTVSEPTSSDANCRHASFELPPSKAKVRLVDAENPAELIRLLHEEAKVL